MRLAENRQGLSVYVRLLTGSMSLKTNADRLGAHLVKCRSGGFYFFNREERK